MQLLRWNNPRAPHRTSVFHGERAGGREPNSRLRWKENNVLDIPFYRPDGMRRPVSDGMLYAPKISTRSKRKR
jgi:hypothetical protein